MKCHFQVCTVGRSGFLVSRVLVIRYIDEWSTYVPLLLDVRGEHIYRRSFRKVYFEAYVADSYRKDVALKCKRSHKEDAVAFRETRIYRYLNLLRSTKEFCLLE